VCRVFTNDTLKNQSEDHESHYVTQVYCNLLKLHKLLFFSIGQPNNFILVVKHKKQVPNGGLPRNMKDIYY
jgi:hypothetical protein